MSWPDPARSELSHDRSHWKRICWILALCTLASAGIYLLVSALFYRAGFPLDDAWIHQTYARNLALKGEWAFIPGKASGGSTAPLWSALLAVGFWIRLAPYIWAYLLGAVALWGIAVLSEKSVRRMVPTYTSRFPWVGAVLLLEWHLVWGALSGMETLLFTLLAMLVLTLLIAGSKRFFSLGLLAGLSVWIRPDGITLLGPLAMVLLLTLPNWRGRLRAMGGLVLGFGSLFAFYLLFNLMVAGSPWPNTFYAKQAEYAIYLKLPFWKRVGMEILQPLIGVGIALLPGMIMMIISAVRRRKWAILAAAAWSVGFLVLYAVRLPVTYQHGRYLIPAMPVLFLLGLAGMVEFISQARVRVATLAGTFWKISTGLILLLFCGQGAYAYARDVAVIESEMVDTARWVADNVPPQALVAAHDIGALGYFGEHDLVDLAGLVSPEVIPFIRDESRIARYLSEKRVEYLVTFPDWYPILTADLDPVFTSGAVYAPAFGEMNMAVYRWNGH